MSGQIVDASLIAAPKQRNTDDERKALKEGRVPEDWKAMPAKLRHKDRDARWTVKFTKAKERPDAPNHTSETPNHRSAPRTITEWPRAWARSGKATERGRR